MNVLLYLKISKKNTQYYHYYKVIKERFFLHLSILRSIILM